MPVKSVLQVSVDDKEFRRYASLFQSYQDELAKTPGAWRKVSQAGGESAKFVEAITASMLAQQQLAQERGGDEKQRADSTERIAGLWTSITHSSESFLKNVVRSTESLLRWTGIIGGVSGLLGAGGLWGIDRLAAHASDERRSSLGLGLTIGQAKAFATDYGRFADTSAVLSGVGEATANVALQGPLYALGVNPNQSTDKVVMATMQAIRALVLKTPVNQLGLLDSQFHLGQLGYGVEDLRRIRSATPQEWDRQGRQYQRDAGALDISGATADRWREFTAQMSRAESTIFKVFVQGLLPLEGPLERLSGSVVHLIEHSMKPGGPLEHGIDNVAHWLDHLGNQVGSSKFQKDIDDLLVAVGRMGTGIASVATELPDLATVIHTIAHPLDAAEDKAASVWGNVVKYWGHSTDALKSDPAFFQKWLQQLDVGQALPGGLVETVKQLENSGEFAVSPRGAQGMFQLMPGTAKQYGADPFDKVQAAEAAAHYLGDLSREFHGDIAKVLAAYNYGPKNVEDLSRQYQKDWQSHLPKETRQYVMQGASLMGAIGGVTININNNTGGNAQVSMSQLAPQ